MWETSAFGRVPSGGVKGGTIAPFHALHGHGISRALLRKPGDRAAWVSTAVLRSIPAGDAGTPCSIPSRTQRGAAPGSPASAPLSPGLPAHPLSGSPFSQDLETIPAGTPVSTREETWPFPSWILQRFRCDLNRYQFILIYRSGQKST